MGELDRDAVEGGMLLTLLCTTQLGCVSESGPAVC